MQLYIQKWGRRVGFDLNVQPSDEALTHAIIQVLLGAEVPHPASAQHAASTMASSTYCGHPMPLSGAVECRVVPACTRVSALYS
jgi:hypothetical protein